jgi:hypothetical protein
VKIPAAECTASFSSPSVRSRSRQWKKSWRSVTPKSTCAGIRVIQSMNAGLNSSRSAIGSWSRGTVAMKCLFISTLSNSTRRRECRSTTSSAFRSIDSTLKIGTTVARSGMWAFTSVAPGTIAFRPNPPSRRSSASQNAPQNPSSISPVTRFVPPGQRATGPPAGLSPPTGS